MKPAVAFILTFLLGTLIVSGQMVVFQTGFEYPNGELPTIDEDIAVLNGALDQVGSWSGNWGTGLGDAAPAPAFFREIGGDHFLLIDRPEAPFVMVASLAEAVPIDGTRVGFQFSTKRVGGHAKDSHFVGLDAQGRESFHVVVSANNVGEGESLRLGIETNGGEAIWDLDTVEGEDNDGDFPFNNATGNTNNVGTVVLNLQADGYVMTVSKGEGNLLYQTAVLPYNGDEAEEIATIEFRGNGGTTGVSTGLWLNDIAVSHSASISDPGLFLIRSIDFGAIPQTDEVQERVLSVSNEGATNVLTITGASSSGANADNFAITDFPGSLDPGETGELTVAFNRMGDVGEFEAVLILETNDPDAADESAMINVSALVPAGGDTDEDGLTDAEEGELGTDPALSDTDGDGLKDGEEVNEFLTSPVEVDTDGDGFEDGEEVAFGSDPLERTADLDMDGLTDEEEFVSGSNPGLADTDGDTLNDGEEVNGNPPSDPTLADTDGDSLADNEELTRGTDASLADSDGDELDDGFEILLGSDPVDIDSPIEGGGTAVVFQSGFEYSDGFPDVGLDARNLNGADDQLGSFFGDVPEADVTGGLLDGETITPKAIADDNFILVDRPLAPHMLKAELVSPVPVSGSIVSFEYVTRRTGSHEKDVSIVGLDDGGQDVFEVIVSAKSDPPDGQRLGTRGPDVDGLAPEPTFDFEVVSGEDAWDDFPNGGANPGVNAISAVKVFLLAEGFVIDYKKPGRGYRTALLPYRSAASTLTSIEFRVNGGGTGISSGFFLDDLVVESAGKPSDPNIIVSPRINLGPLAVSSAQPVSVRVLNTGATQALALSDVRLSGADQGHFSLVSFPESIAAGESGMIELLFDARLRTGPFQVLLDIEANDPDIETTKVELSALGVDLAGPLVHLKVDEAAGAGVLENATTEDVDTGLVQGDGSVTLGIEGLASGTGASITGNGALTVSGDAINELAEVSVSMWVNLEATGASPQTLFAKGEAPTPNIALITQGGDLSWFIDGDVSITTATGNALVAGQAHHVVGVYGNDRAAIYVDGELLIEATETTPLRLDALNAWAFGGFGSLPFDGLLDDIQIYDRTLTSDEVATLLSTPGEALSSGTPVVDPPSNERRFAVPSLTRSPNGQVLVRWLAAQDVGYRVEFSEDLQVWEAIDDTGFAVDVNDAVLEDENQARISADAGYYRVVLLP